MRQVAFIFKMFIFNNKKDQDHCNVEKATAVYHISVTTEMPSHLLEFEGIRLTVGKINIIGFAFGSYNVTTKLEYFVADKIKIGLNEFEILQEDMVDFSESMSDYSMISFLDNEESFVLEALNTSGFTVDKIEQNPMEPQTENLVRLVRKKK